MNEDYKKLKPLEKFEVLKLAIKYWISGDKWDFAMEYAIGLVKGWKKTQKKT